jgi:hypothetical protein
MVKTNPNFRPIPQRDDLSAQAAESSELKTLRRRVETLKAPPPRASRS